MAEQTFFSGAQGLRPISSFGSGSLGTAEGRIVIDTSQLNQAVAASQRASTQIQNTFGGGLQRNIQSAGQAITRQAMQMSAGFEQIARSTAAMSAAGTALTVFGVAQAQRLQRVNQLMRIFSGSNELAEQRLDSIRDMSERTGRSYVELAEGALAILPAVGRANVDLEKTLSLVQRLALIDPAQGIEGASLAIRELLGGQTRSLVARFEMSATQLDALMDSAGGDPQRVLDGLDEMVNAFGLTDAAMQEMGDSGVNAFNALRGAAEEAAATGFNDFLKSAQSSARAMADWLNNLRETQPEVLRFATGAAVAVAAIAPLAFIISKIAAAFGVLVTVLTSPVFLTVLGLLGAVVAAGAVTTRIMQELADIGIGDQRLRTDSGENPVAVLFDRFKQALLSVVTILLRLGVELGAATARWEAQWTFFWGKLQSTVHQGFLEFLAGMAGVAAALADMLPLGAGSQLAASNRAAQQVFLERAAEAGKARQGVELMEALLLDAIAQARDQAMSDLNTNTLEPLLRLLYPTPDKTARLGPGFTPGKGLDMGGKDARPLWEQVIAPFRDAITGATDAAREYGRESAALTQEFAKQTRQLLAARALADARRQADDQLSDTRALRDRQIQTSRSDSDFWGGIARQMSDFNQTVQSNEAQSLAARAKALADFQTDQTRRTEDHLRRIADIERTMMASVAEAALGLDASGVTRAYRQGGAQLRSENETFDRERAGREAEYQQRAAEAQQQFAQQRGERLAAFAQQQADQIAQFQLQRQRQTEDYALRQADQAEDRRIRAEREATDRALEDARRQQEFDERLVQLAADLGKESGLWDGLGAAVSRAGETVRNAIAGIFDVGISKAQQAQQALNAAQTAMNNAYTYQQQRQTAAQTAMNNAYAYQQQRQTAQAWTPFGYRVPTFASGGIASGLAIVGEDGPELAQFTQPTRIYDANDTRQMLKGQETNVHIGNFAPVFGDIGNRSREEVIGMIDEALYQFFSQGAALAQ